MTHLAPITHRPPPPLGFPQSSVGHWGPLFVALILGCWAASFVIGFEMALTILAVGGFSAAVVGLFRPVIGLLGVGMLCTLEPLMRSLLFTGGLWRWHTLDYWLSLVAIMFASLLLGLNDARNRLVQVFAVLLAVEVLVSPDWYSGLQDVAGVVAVFGLVVYFVRAAEGAAVWRWLGLVCGTTGAVGGIAVLMQQANVPQINPNAWAYFPLTALFGICLAFPRVRSSARGQVVLAMLAAANYTLVFLSGSRGTLLTATGCGVVLLILTQQMRRRWLVALTAPLVALAITTQFTDLQTRAANRISLLLEPGHSLIERTSGRSQLVVSGWNMFLEHPLGVGTGGYTVTRTSVTGEGLSQWRPNWQARAHAGWIKILAENGLPGIALMCAYVLSFSVAGWRSQNRELFVLGLLVTMAFGLGFLSTEYHAKGLWFLAAGVMVLLTHGSALTRNERTIT